MKKIIQTMLPLLAIVLASCQKAVDPPESPSISESRAYLAKPVSNTFYGSQVQLGDGHMRSWIRISPEGVPEEIGLEMTKGILQNLPTAYTEMELDLHQKASTITPYNHIGIDWMPNGHPPPYFQLPHFDIHFYMLTEEEKMSIPAPRPTNTNLAKVDSFGTPAPGVLPADYTVPSAAIARMGRHWLDKNADVLPPKNATFTYQFIYGTWNGKVAFLEPMVTRAFLLSGTEVHNTIKQPAIYNLTGTYYPTGYNIYTDEKTGRVYVSLSGFVWR